MMPPVTPESVHALIDAHYNGHVSLFAKAAGVDRITLTRYLAGGRIRAHTFAAIARHAQSFVQDLPLDDDEDDGAALAAMELIQTGMEVLVAWLRKQRLLGKAV